MNLKVQTNIEVGLDLNEYLYERLPFIFHDFYQKSKITFNPKLLFLKNFKIKNLKKLIRIKLTTF
jgi:hypothetical protein